MIHFSFMYVVLNFCSVSLDITCLEIIYRSIPCNVLTCRKIMFHIFKKYFKIAFNNCVIKESLPHQIFKK